MDLLLTAAVRAASSPPIQSIYAWGRSGIIFSEKHELVNLSLFVSVFVPPDPVPAFKSWQDDSEGGEAQLSPLAGRMVPLPPLPLEEEGEEDEKEGGQEASPSSSRSHPHLLARRFLDFGAHSSQRFLQQDPDVTSPTKAQRYFCCRLKQSCGFYLKIRMADNFDPLWLLGPGLQATASIVWLQRGHERSRFSDPPAH